MRKKSQVKKTNTLKGPIFGRGNELTFPFSRILRDQGNAKLEVIPKIIAQKRQIDLSGVCDLVRILG